MSVVKYVDIEVMKYNKVTGVFVEPKLQWRDLDDRDFWIRNSNTREFLLRYDNDIQHMAYMLFNEPIRMHCFGENRRVLVNMYDPFDDKERLVL